MSALDHINESITRTEEQIKKLDADILAMREFLYLLKSEKTKRCPHTNTFTKDAFDYHNRVDWTETHCADCGKYLGKV